MPGNIEFGFHENLIGFAVSKTGDVVNVTIARSVHPTLDKESVRVVKTLPKWKPGTINGKEAKVWYTVPITFHLN